MWRALLRCGQAVRARCELVDGKQPITKGRGGLPCKIEPRRPRYEPAVSGEDLRREFEARIEARTDELMAELDAAEAAAEAA